MLDHSISRRADQSLRIFALHRGANEDVEILEKAIHEHFDSIAGDLTGSKEYLFARQISGAVQEFVEAMLFKNYLETKKLAPYGELDRLLPMKLTPDDYILGVLDFTGELMRYSISHLITEHIQQGRLHRRVSPIAQEIHEFMEELYMTLDIESGLYQTIHSFESKMNVFKDSLQKVSDAIFSVALREGEVYQSF